MSRIPEIPSEPVHPGDWPPHPPKKMVMSPAMVTIGGMIAFAAVVFMVVVLPTTTFEPEPSENWRPLTAQEQEGRDIFLANGCIYCHSGFSRPQDVYASQYYVYARASEPGDYTGPGETPNLFGTIRTGPDLSQSGGFHPDDWHYAHYANPRFTTPLSIMPRFDFLSEDQVASLVAFTQSRGGKLADLRSDHQQTLKNLTLASDNVVAPGENGDRSDGYPAASAIKNLMLIDRGYWFADNPLPVTDENLLRGREVYQLRCQGCHGSNGDGNGPAAIFFNPPPADFTSPDDAANGSDTSPGAYYWRILRGVPGTAMENFGTRLSVDDIWRVALFLKTIPNGGLSTDLPSVDQYIQWHGYPKLFDWGECFWSVNSYYTNRQADSGGPDGAGDVPGMVDPGKLNPVYAVTLWELENNARPCGTPGYETTDLASILDEAVQRTDGYARQLADQSPFIPTSMFDPSTAAPATLPGVWAQRDAPYGGN